MTEHPPRCIRRRQDLLIENEIDMEALLLCAEEDLAEIGLKKGPRVKLLTFALDAIAAGAVSPLASPMMLSAGNTEPWSAIVAAAMVNAKVEGDSAGMVGLSAGGGGRQPPGPFWEEQPPTAFRHSFDGVVKSAAETEAADLSAQHPSLASVEVADIVRLLDRADKEHARGRARAAMAACEAAAVAAATTGPSLPTLSKHDTSTRVDLGKKAPLSEAEAVQLVMDKVLARRRDGKTTRVSALAGDLLNRGDDDGLRTVLLKYENKIHGFLRHHSEVFTLESVQHNGRRYPRDDMLVGVIGGIKKLQEHNNDAGLSTHQFGDGGISSFYGTKAWQQIEKPPAVQITQSQTVCRNLLGTAVTSTAQDSSNDDEHAQTAQAQREAAAKMASQERAARC
eukprot:COSAG01_NODE_2432_length_7707_cov_17.497240_7_plen_395_part_00